MRDFIKGILKSFAFGVAFVLGALSIYAAWQSGNPGINDSSLFVSGSGSTALTADKWNALINEVKIAQTTADSAQTIATNAQTTADGADSKVDSIVASAGGVSIPSDAVMSFASDVCPDGWSEYTPAYGRFIRGIDKSGTSIDPDGQRGYGELQEDLYKSHTHPYLYSSSQWTSPKPYSGGFLGVNSASSGSYGYAYNTGGAGGAETRAKNVALLYCIKD